MNLYSFCIIIIKFIHITSVHESYDWHKGLFTFKVNSISVFLKNEGRHFLEICKLVKF